MKRWQQGLTLVVVIMAVVLWLSQMNYVPTTNVLVLSAAREMIAGHGAVLPTIDPRAATYPLTPTLLSIVLSIINNPNVAMTLLAVLAASVATYFLVRIIDDAWTGATFLLAASAVRSLPECVMLAFALASVFIAKQGRWQIAGVLMALAITAHPAAIILAVLVAIWAWQSDPQKIWQYVVPAAGISAVFLYVLTENGAWTLATLDTHVPFVSLIIATLLYLLVDKSALRERPLTVLLLSWSVVLLVISAVTRQWPTLIIVPGVLAFASLRWLTHGIGMVVLALDLLLIPFVSRANFIGVSRVPPETTAWLAENTAPDTIIASGVLGVDAYTLNRPLIDLSSTFKAPDEHRTLSDPTFFVRYAPDVVVISGELQQVAWSNFPTTYAKVFGSGYDVYQRVVNFTPLDPYFTEVVFNDNIPQRRDLVLVEAGIADEVKPSDLVRVRLTWMLAYNPSFELQMRVMLVDAQGNVVASANDKFVPEYWQTGERDTYHLLPLPAELNGDELTLRVGIGIREGDLGEHDILTIKIVR
jgi:hypothetical protein